MFSVVLVSIVMHLQPVMAENRIIRLGGYRWVSINGSPFVRYSRSGHNSDSLSQLNSDDFVNPKIRDGQTQDDMNYLFPLNEQDVSYQGFPTDRVESDYKMDMKRTNYIRLAKRSEDYFAEPKMSQDEIIDYAPVRANENILYPVF